MKRLLRIDWFLLLPMIALIAIGIVFIRSAGSARPIAILQESWKTHATAAGAGLALYCVLAAVDYRKLLDWTAIPFYVLSLAFLVAVLVFGSKIYGGRRWLWFFQPSELSKIAVILALAKLFGNPPPPPQSLAPAKETDALAGWRGLMTAGAVAGVPLVLVLVEPDLGTACALLPAVLAMLFAARTCLKALVPLVLAAVLTVGALLGAVWAAERAPSPERRARIHAAIPLLPHQIQRLRVFLSPDTDPYGSGWTARQAKISIGSGSFAGKGVGKGEQKFLGYLPPSVSMNDFIFAVLGEEAGFRGTALTLLLFAILLLAALNVGRRCPDERGRLIAVGASTLLFAHVYVNVGMTVGFMPITGIPLPFISAGKTFLIVTMALLGVLQSVAIHRDPPAEDGSD